MGIVVAGLLYSVIYVAKAVAKAVAKIVSRPDTVTLNENAPQNGKKFSYFDEPLSPQFVITDIDSEENELRGYIEIPLPIGAEAIDVLQDLDNNVFVKYRLPDGKFVNKFWGLDEKPKELGGWYVDWTEVTATPRILDQA